MPLAELRRAGRSNAASWDDAAPADLHGRFALQAAWRPDARAIVTPCETWTYADLQRRAGQIAGAIVRSEAPPRACVALLLADPAETVAAMLGIFAAGRVMVPLDPTWPASRVARVLSDVGTRLLVTEEALRSQADDLPASSTLVLRGRDEERIASASRCALPEVDAASLAYVLFTSGSTGEPKGVMQSHRNAVAHIRAYTLALGIGEKDRLTMLSSCAVDAAVMDIWGALLNGASLHAVDPRTAGPAGIARWVHEQRITILHATPTVFRHVAGALHGDEDLSSLRFVVLGGEPARRRDFDLYRERLPRGTTLVNGFGPTESTIGLQCFLDHDSAVEGDILPLGHPTEGVDVVLLEVDHASRGAQGTGEIGLASSRVALGYWGREDLTARSFLPDPEGGGRRIYRTGDLGFHHPDGSLGFAGRRDLRIKSRGHWVDPPAVEARLLRHPLVRDAIVVPWQDATGQTRPGACLVVAGCAPGAEELRAFVALELPEAANPMNFALFDAWPLTASGKVDLAALRARLASSSAPGVTFSAPWDETEATIARLLSEVLGIRSPGRHDSFFALGGDSLAAVQMAARIERDLGAALDLRAMLEHPTVAGLSRAVRAARLSGSSPAPPILRVPRDTLMPVSLHQRRYLARLAGGEASTSFNIAFESHLRGPLVEEAFVESLRAVVRRHEALRTAFGEHGDGYSQRISADVALDLPVLDLHRVSRSEAEATLATLRAEAAAHVFDISRAPLIRATLVRCTDELHVLIWTIHHLVADGWSRRVIEDDLLSFYTATVAGRAPPLGALPLQYADYAAWLDRASRPDGVFGPQLDYWRSALRGFEPIRLHRESAGEASQTVAQELGEGLADRLLRFGSEAGATPFMVLLAAFALALASYTGRSDVVVTTDVAGRTPPETEAIVGLFTNVVPVRVDVSGDPDLWTLVARTRASVLAVLENKDLPFAVVADALWPGRLHEYDELFPVAFFVEDRRDGRASLPLPVLRSRELEAASASRDLMLVIGQPAERPSAELTYRTARVGAEAARRLLAAFEVVLEALVGNPSERASRVAARFRR